MLTIFAIPKPFIGHIGTIQRNSIISWTKLNPKPEIILFGTDQGVKEICQELDLVHIPSVAANEYNTPLVSDLFRRAQERAKYPTLGFINPDLILLDDFMPAVKKTVDFRRQFLLAGERWDLDIKEEIDFNNPNWQNTLRKKVKTQGTEHGFGGVDYFVFSKGAFDNIPDFAVGRPYYDNWFFWKILSKGLPIIDASGSVVSIHQNHERTYSSMGKAPIKGEDQLRKGIEAEKNFALCGGDYNQIYNILSATYLLTNKGIKGACTADRLDRRVAYLEERQRQALTNFRNYTEKLKTLTDQKNKIDKCLDKSSKDIDALENSIINKALGLLKKRDSAVIVFASSGLLFFGTLFLVNRYFGIVGISYLLGFGIFSLIIIAIEFYRRLQVYNKSRFDKIAIDNIINRVNLEQQISQIQNSIHLARRNINQVIHTQNDMKRQHDKDISYQKQASDANNLLLNELNEKQDQTQKQQADNIYESKKQIVDITQKLNQYEQQFNQLQQKAQAQQDTADLQNKSNQDILRQLSQLQKQAQAQQDKADLQNESNQDILKQLGQLHKQAQVQQDTADLQNKSNQDILKQQNQLQKLAQAQQDTVYSRIQANQNILKQLNELKQQAKIQKDEAVAQKQSTHDILNQLEVLRSRAKIQQDQTSSLHQNEQEVLKYLAEIQQKFQNLHNNFKNIKDLYQQNTVNIEKTINSIKTEIRDSEQLNEIQDQIGDIERQVFTKPEDKSHIYLTMLRKSDRFRVVKKPHKNGRAKAETFWGEQMTTVLPDDVSVNIYRKGFLEKGLSVMILKYLKPGMAFLDIGAHIGFYTLLASEITGENGQVHSFEPTPDVFNILKTNTTKKKNIFLNKRALWSSRKSMVFKDFGLGWSAFNSFFEPRIEKATLEKLKHVKHTLVTTTIDKYVIDKKIRPDFIKLDAESAEYEILLGMENTIKKYHPIISVEVGDENISGAKPSKEVIEHIISKGYIPYEFKKGIIVKHSLKNSYQYDNILFLSSKSGKPSIY